MLAGGAGAATLTVDSSGGTMYMRIQDAIDNASAGDTILVYSGRYYENVDVNKQLILRGVDNGGGIPVVNANRSGSAITLSAGNSTLEGFTTTNSGISWADVWVGAGIMVTSNNNIIKGNNASYNQFGISVLYSDNNTISNNNASNNGNLTTMGIGIYLRGSGNNSLISNTALNNTYYGVSLLDSKDNGLKSNTIFNNNYNGIKFVSSNNNTLSGNNVSGNGNLSVVIGIPYIHYYEGSIDLGASSNNTLSGNIVYSNYENGIYLHDFSNNNTLSNNFVNSNEDTGIYLHYSDNSVLNGSIVSDNAFGINLAYSGNGTLTNNIMTGNKYNFRLDESADSRFDNQIDTSNLVNGKPVYYIKGAANTVYDSSTNAGTFYCINCVNVTLKDINLSANDAGVYFWMTNNSRIQNVNASNNYHGISMYSSSNNTLSGNAVISNNWVGIMLEGNNNTLSGNNASNNDVGIMIGYSSNNILHANNASNNRLSILLGYPGFSNNTSIYNNILKNISIIYNSGNKWNITKTNGTNIIGGPYLGGNVWVNQGGTGFSQTCADGDSDGICDSPYALDTSNTDYLPLAKKSALPPEVSAYDSSNDGIIQRGEAVAAVVAFFNGNTSRATAVAVVVSFFSAPAG